MHHSHGFLKLTVALVLVSLTGFAVAPMCGLAANPSQERGKELFYGTDRFESGDTSCISCHDVARAGALGGGKIGPDLTLAADRFGGAKGLAGWLGVTASPTMQPIYLKDSKDGKSKVSDLTKGELESLGLFLEAEAAAAKEDGTKAPAAGNGATASEIIIMAVIGLVVFIAIMGVFAMTWAKRFKAVRKPMVQSAKLPE